MTDGGKNKFPSRGSEVSCCCCCGAVTSCLMTSTPTAIFQWNNGALKKWLPGEFLKYFFVGANPFVKTSQSQSQSISATSRQQNKGWVSRKILRWHNFFETMELQFLLLQSLLLQQNYCVQQTFKHHNGIYWIQAILNGMVSLAKSWSYEDCRTTEQTELFRQFRSFDAPSATI